MTRDSTAERFSSMAHPGRYLVIEAIQFRELAATAPTQAEQSRVDQPPSAGRSARFVSSGTSHIPLTPILRVRLALVHEPPADGDAIIAVLGREAARRLALSILPSRR
jgi:hypothetical protein